MPQVIITAGAGRGLERCRQYIFDKNPAAAKRAGQCIERQFALLESNPEIGRPYPDVIELREMVIVFGDSGYVALYRYQPNEVIVYVLAFRHQKEAGY